MTLMLHGPIAAARCAVLLFVGSAATVLPAQTASQAAPPPSAFAKTNLHAWAYEEYDAVPRTPSERATLLKTLGLTRAGYVGRNVERMKEFDSYVTAYREQRIELVAVWTPVHTDAPLEEPHIRMFLDAVERRQLRPQWWVTLEQFAKVSDEQAIDRASAVLRPLLVESANRGLRLAVYGHGRDSWFTQPENQIAIVERLRSGALGSLGTPRARPPERSGALGAPASDGAGESEGRSPSDLIGIAYNFHHAHSQLDRFAEVFPKVSPYLTAVNLNGMKPEGPMILRIKEGTHEQEMIAAIHRSGFQGPVGVLHHERKMDAAVVLRRNMEGLRDILKAIGDFAGASTY